MITIGILGGFVQTSEILIQLCKHFNQKTAVVDSESLSLPKPPDICIVDALKAPKSLLESNHTDILIINKCKSENLIENLRLSRPDSVVLINSDVSDNFRLLRNTQATLITYGFNSKACVTASSVANGNFNTIQCCIQRSIKTLSGRLLEEQEFPIHAVNKDTYNVLGAITAALLSNVDILNLEQPLVV